MRINLIVCKTEDEEEEIVNLLKNKYKNNKQCKFRLTSNTLILPDKKWIPVSPFWAKQFQKRNPAAYCYSMEEIKDALLNN